MQQNRGAGLAEEPDVRRAKEGKINPGMRRRLEVGREQRDFLVLDEFFADGATDYFAQLNHV